MVMNRSKTTSIPLLVLYSSLFWSHAILLIQSHSVLAYENMAAALGTFAALVGTASILRMPMRDPDLPNDQISPAFNVPDPLHRSPEDNLSLWQFMTVSWMGPLISLGAKRQLHDQDIWMLGYEFQHRRLHNTFRELQGSVLRRVFVANRIDLVIISLLGLLELLASMVFSPEPF